MTTFIRKFFPLTPGTRFEGDWFNGTVPENIIVGENTVADSTHCFKNYHSLLKTGLKVGSHVTFWRTSLAVEESGMVEIGDFCYIANASIVCSKEIRIGSYVLIAGGVTIVDSDFHPVDPLNRLKDAIALSPLGDRSARPTIITKPVLIGDNVWIGFNATILKGVTIGTGAVIEPGAVVLKDVLPGQRVSGNPAK